MRLAMLFDQNEYLNNDNVPILAVEVVDDANTSLSTEITFTDNVNLTYSYASGKFLAGTTYYLRSGKGTVAEPYEYKKAQVFVNAVIPENTYFVGSSRFYMKKLIDVADDSYKKTIISNYSDCTYSKSVNVIVPGYTSPSNRAILDANLIKRYPLIIDQSRLGDRSRLTLL